jgi:hypothetical protein
LYASIASSDLPEFANPVALSYSFLSAERKGRPADCGKSKALQLIRVYGLIAADRYDKSHLPLPLMTIKSILIVCCHRGRLGQKPGDSTQATG